jgi:polysaccharide deacetylase family protein (PEP-CTERM system associated)
MHSTNQIDSANSGPASLAKAIFSVDVEDWFHILDVPSTPPLAMWDTLPSRVEKNFYHLLDLFSRKNARVTCFFLGWIAERFPHLVKEAVRRGHEIASHGYEHRLVYETNRREFYEDALRSRELLESIAGLPVRGYRSAGFSVTEETPWFFEELAAAGYSYDSSVFPAQRGHGGIREARRNPYIVQDGKLRLLEFPMTVIDVAGKPMCFFGGGYLRFFPYWLIRKMARKVIDSGRPLVFYVHPREIDPSHPRLPMSWRRQFKSYVNLHHTEKKILRILEEFPVTTYGEFLAQPEKLGRLRLPLWVGPESSGERITTASS